MTERVPIISVVPKEDQRNAWQFCYAVGNTFDEVIEGKAVALLDELVHVLICRQYGLKNASEITRNHADLIVEFLNEFSVDSIHDLIVVCYENISI